MPKSRGRKPKKKRTPASAPTKRLDNFNTTRQEPPLSTQPPQEPPLATTPRQDQSTPKIEQMAKVPPPVVLAAVGIVLCPYAFILTKQWGGTQGPVLGGLEISACAGRRTADIRERVTPPPPVGAGPKRTRSAAAA